MENIIQALLYLFSIYLVYRSRKKTNRKFGWIIGSVLIPFIVPIIYFLTMKRASKSQQSAVEGVQINLNSSTTMTTSYDLKVVGVSFDNDDGTSRQAALKMCKSGDKITLKRQPTTTHPNVVQVWANAGMIGHVSSVEAERLAPIMDNGSTVIAKVKKIIGGTPEKSTLGCIIDVKESKQY